MRGTVVKRLRRIAGKTISDYQKKGQQLDYRALYKALKANHLDARRRGRAL